MLVALLAGLTAYFPAEATWQVLPRLTIAVIAVMIAPGWVFLRIFDPYPLARDYVSHISLSIASSFILITFLGAALFFFNSTIFVGLNFMLCVLIILSPVLLLRTEKSNSKTVYAICLNPAGYEVREQDRVYIVSLVIVLSLLGFFFGWQVGSVLGGEEIYELVTIRKIVESQNLEINKITHHPDSLPTYIFASYSTLISFIVKVSGLDMLVAYVKLRGFYVVFAAVCFGALAAILFANRTQAVIFAGSLLAITFVDPDSWYLFPSVRRGGFASSILALSCILITFHALYTPKHLRTPLTFAILPAAYACLATTHGTEAVYFLFWLFGLCMVGIVLERSHGSVVRAAALCLPVVVIALAIKLGQSSIDEHIDQFEALRESLGWRTPDSVSGPELRSHPLTAIFGGMTLGGENALFGLHQGGGGPAINHLPILLLPVLVLSRPRLGWFLWLCIAAPILLFSTPIGTYLLLSQISIELTLGGRVFFAPIYAIMTIVMILALVNFAEEWLRSSPRNRVTAIITDPRLGIFLSPLLVGGVSYLVLSHIVKASNDMMLQFATWLPAIIVLTCPVLAFWQFGARQGWSWCGMPWRFEVDRRPTTFWSVVVMLALVAPLSARVPDQPARVNLFQQAITSWDKPSITQWKEYYPVFQKTSAPTIDLPLSVLEEIRRLIPEESIVVYDPRYSYTLAVLMNIFVVNPEHLLSSDLLYHQKYVVNKIHPIFNDNSELTELELCFLIEFSVDYIVTNPVYDALVRQKIRSTSKNFFEELYHRDGSSVFAVRPELIESQAVRSIDCAT